MRMVGHLATIDKPDGARFSAASGLRLTLDASRLQAEVTGYTILLIAVESQAPLSSDTTLRIVFSTSNSHERADFVVREEWTLPAGMSRETLRLKIPSHGVQQLCWWDIWVDQSRDEQLSQEREHPIVLPTLMGAMPAEVSPLRLLDTSYRDPKNFTWRDVLSATLSGGKATQPPREVPLAENVIAIFIPDDLPERWEDLLPLDIVRIEMSALVKAKAERPEAFQSLIRWVHAGGNLWVDGMDDDWEKLPELTRLLGWQDRDPQTAPRIPGEEEPTGVGAWDALDLAVLPAAYGQDGVPPLGADDTQVWVEQMRENLRAMGTEDPAKEIPPFYSDNWMAVRQMGWGSVAAFRQDWFATSSGLKKSHREAAVRYWLQRSWFERHGTNPRLSNGDFSSWLVPGVGSAPVLEFQFLITLFVIVIGPLNYWLLKRAGRLHLLVVTIPLVASLVTVALLGYGLLADGWRTQVRAMSITYIDREHDLASSWSRLSYYAAFAPRNGLEFGRDAQVYAIAPGAYEAFADPDRSQQSLSLKWTDEGQQLERGWLNSRTPTQLLVVDSQAGVQGLKIRRREQDLMAESPFAAPLEWVAAVDEEGKWYQAQKVPPEGRFSLAEATEAEVVTTFRRLVQDRQPSVPAELLENPLPYRSSRHRYSYWHQHSAMSFETSLLAMRWTLLNGRETYPALRLPPRSYIVVGDRALATGVGLDDAEESGSVHLVLGDW